MSEINNPPNPFKIEVDRDILLYFCKKDNFEFCFTLSTEHTITVKKRFNNGRIDIIDKDKKIIISFPSTDATSFVVIFEAYLKYIIECENCKGLTRCNTYKNMCDSCIEAKVMTSEHTRETKCAICLEPLCFTSHYKPFKCTHFLHDKCMKKNVLKCPSCRADHVKDRTRHIIVNINEEEDDEVEETDTDQFQVRQLYV